MPNLQIPDDARPAIAKIARLDPAAYAELTEFLQEATPGFRAEDLLASLPSEAKTVSLVDLRSMVDVLQQIALVRSIAEIPLDRFVSDVSSAMGMGDEVVLNEGEQTTLRDRLGLLLNLKSVDTPSKARSLSLDVDNAFCRARIITDVRPVFGSDVMSSPSTAVIVNTLRLTYHNGPRLRNVFLTLDRDDLDTLSELVERAKTKTETLHRFLVKAALQPIDSD